MSLHPETAASFPLQKILSCKYLSSHFSSTRQDFMSFHFMAREQTILKREQKVNDNITQPATFLSCKNMKERDFCGCCMRSQNIIYILCITLSQISIQLLCWSGTHPTLIPRPGLVLAAMALRGQTSIGLLSYPAVIPTAVIIWSRLDSSPSFISNRRIPQSRYNFFTQSPCSLTPWGFDLEKKQTPALP